MSKSTSEASDDFEFIETPAAPTPTPPAHDFGVRTTSVSRVVPSIRPLNAHTLLMLTYARSIRVSKMDLYLPTLLAARTSPIFSF